MDFLMAFMAQADKVSNGIAAVFTARSYMVVFINGFTAEKAFSALHIRDRPVDVVGISFQWPVLEILSGYSWIIQLHHGEFVQFNRYA